MANFMKPVSKTLDSFIRFTGKAALKKRPVTPLADPIVDYLSESDSEKFTLGFSKCVMLPADIESEKYYIAGYGENNPAKGVIDPQYCHCVWIDDNTGRGAVLFISLDVVGILKKDVDKAKKMLSQFCELTGCRSINIVSTHNHAGIDTMGIWGPLPFSGKNEKFMNIVFESIKKTAFAAYKNRKDGDLYLGTVEVPDMQEDIRTPIVYSKTLTRFRFVPDDGSNETWILNFASHSESLQGCNHLVSADFPCYLREYIKDKAGADVLYGVGAIGGMISMDIPEENLLRKEFRLIENTRKIGYKLGSYAVSIKDDKKLKPLINFAKSEFYAEVDNSILTIACQIGLLTADKYACEKASKNWMLKSEVSYFEIGGKKLLLLPCEIFPELVFGGALSAEESATGKGPEVNPELLCDIVEDKDILVFGLANDELGYVLPPNDFILNKEQPYLDKTIDIHGRRHYEETNSMGPKTAATIADAVSTIYRAFLNSK